MGIYTGDWTYGQYLKAVREVKEAGKNGVTLCTEHCSERSDEDLKAWGQKDGYGVMVEMDHVIIRFNHE